MASSDEAVARRRPSRLVDYNGDGEDDAFFYDPGSGAWSLALGGYVNRIDRGGTWSPGLKVLTADLNGDRAADVFAYNVATGQWYQCIHSGDGDFIYYSGIWAADWEPHVADLDGDDRDDIFVYSAQTGDWHKCVTDGRGGFTYQSGTWTPGWEVHLAELNGDGIVTCLRIGRRRESGRNS